MNKVPLPQAGIRRHDVDSTAYDITPVKFKMSTTLSKKPKTKEEWYYKGIYYIIVKYCGPISDPDDGGTIYFEQNYEHRVVFDPKHYGEWGIIYTWVHVIARFTNTDIDAEGDRGISGEDGSIFFQYLENCWWNFNFPPSFRPAAGHGMFMLPADAFISWVHGVGPRRGREDREDRECVF